MAFKLPWSNFHELNLDWLLEKMKELETKVNNIVGGSTPATNTPNMDGVGSPGSSITYSRGDHTHPTDTSRASVSDLNDLATTAYNNYVELNGNINTVDAKIAFSSAAPQVDGVASPGSSPYQARADHVHPTDTSRASQTQVDTLQATVDSWQGSASPYANMPEMDGVGSTGTVASYARGDHQHPSDTSRLPIAGGEITGDLTIDGYLYPKAAATFAQTNATGWLRVAKIPNVPGTNVHIEISKREDVLGGQGELHEIDFNILSNAVTFSHEISAGETLHIGRIRYTDAEYIDIRMDNASAGNIGFRIVSASAPTAEELNTIACESSPDWVVIDPDAETVLQEYTFNKQTDAISSIYVYGKRWYYQRRNGVTTLFASSAIGDDLAAGSHTIGTLPKLYWPPYQMDVPAANNPNVYMKIAVNGVLTLYNSSALANGDPCSLTATWVN